MGIFEKLALVNPPKNITKYLAANAPAKQAIAEQAIARLLTDDFFSVSDPVLALDASSTALEFARRLPNRSMTVISNGLDIVRLLGDRPHIRAIATGGEFDPRGACFIGAIAEATLRKFAIHTACFSCRAVDRQRGCSEASPDHASFKRLLLDISDRKVLLVDRSKLNQRSVAFFAQVEEIDEIITDAPANDPDYVWLTQHMSAPDLKS